MLIKLKVLKYIKRFYYTGILIILVLFGCNEKSIKDSSNGVGYSEIQKNNVDIFILDGRVFSQEIISNGKLEAKEKSTLSFSVSGNLEKLNVNNGDVVNRYETLAVINDFKYKQTVKLAEINFSKSKLLFEDILIGQGYYNKNTDSIPNAIYNMASIRSGLRNSQNELENANFELSSTKLQAPFSGKVAHVQVKKHELISSGQEILTVIQDRYFEVRFNLLESEVKNIRINDSILIEPFAFIKHYSAVVSSINPSISDNGTVLIKAVVKNDGDLIDGMNVRVRIFQEIKDQFVVPKSAVLSRQGKEVLFKYISGEAYWTYINSIKNNSEYTSVIADSTSKSSELKIGDTIIISGNYDLAHKSKVFLNK